MDILQRRGHINVKSNPDPSKEFVATLEGRMATGESRMGCRVMVRYVSDRDIIDPAAFGGYLDVLGTLDWDSLEQVAVAILDDINNEAVPRWVQVSLSALDEIATGVDSHGVLLEDRQPNWNNPSLLSRLKLY